jgi:hypothetical protein
MASESHMKPVDPDDTRTMQERMDAGDWYKAGPEQWDAIARADSAPNTTTPCLSTARKP